MAGSVCVLGDYTAGSVYVLGTVQLAAYAFWGTVQLALYAFWRTVQLAVYTFCGLYNWQCIRSGDCTAGSVYVLWTVQLAVYTFCSVQLAVYTFLGLYIWQCNAKRSVLWCNIMLCDVGTVQLGGSGRAAYLPTCH